MLLLQEWCELNIWHAIGRKDQEQEQIFGQNKALYFVSKLLENVGLRRLNLLSFPVDTAVEPVPSQQTQP